MARTGGRQKGSLNRITRAFRDAVQVAYDAIGGDDAFAAWARENRSAFYQIAAKLIPQELRHAGDEQITVQVVQFFAPQNTVPRDVAIVPKLPGYVEN